MGTSVRWTWLLYFLFLGVVHTVSKELRVVCYYTNWSVYRPGSAKFSPQNINPYLCTHLVYAFGGFTKENTLKPFDKYQDIEKGGYAKFTGLKTYNKNLKTMLAIGGWNEGSSRFSPMVANPERRKELVKNVVKFLRQNHFDGLDLDWEYPSFRDGGKSRDRENYAQLVQELREEFERESGKTGRTRLLLTMAVPAGLEYINKGYDVPKLIKYLDWMNILSYDYHSAFEPSVNHHAPLYPLEEDNEYNYDADLNIDKTIKHYLKEGAISDKLVLGIPTYGRSYTLLNPDANDIGDPADGPGEMGDATRENGYLAYYEICESVKSDGWTVVQPNEDAMGPYAYKDNQWVGYDDEDIARKKAQYVAENNLGGIMFWAIDNDDFRGTCHGKPYPIIEAAKESLIEALGVTDENSISKPLKPTKRGRTRTKVTQKTSSATVTKNSGGRQSIEKSSSRRRHRVSTTERTETSASNRATRRRRPVIKKPVQEEPTARESGSSLVVTTPNYTTPEPPTTPDPGGDFRCEDEGFFPHPRDCKKYFWCLSGPSELGIIAHQFTCPAGLYFNKAASSCDYTQNVLCNKKKSSATTAKPSSPKSTNAKSTTTTEAPKRPEIFTFTTRRPAPKITAATSRTTFVQTTPTTEAPEYEDEYEYEDDVEEEDNNDSEDPRVIKELLELIKKAGGIEELEKQLNFKEGPSASTSLGGTTTQSSITKKLYERVLAKTKLTDLNTKQRYNVINRNSRGPQNEGLGRDESEETTKSRAGRPQYSTIQRQRVSKLDDADKENEAEKEKPKQYSSFRRHRPSISPKEAEDEEDSTNLPDKLRSTTLTSRAPYVTLKRYRPTTEATDKEGEVEESFKRRVLGENQEDLKDSNRASTPNYIVIQRNRPSTTESTGSKYKEIRRTTTPTANEEDSTAAENSEDDDSTATTNKAFEHSTNPQLTNPKDETTLSELLSSTPAVKLSEPRPFSLTNNSQRSTTVKTTTTTTTSSPSKVSDNKQPLYRSRTDQTVDASNANRNNKVVEGGRSSKVRGSSRFTVPDTPVTPRQRAQVYEDPERHYRPEEISDLSSLTAVDFSLLKDFKGNTRRPRPRITSTTTTTVKPTEGLKTGSHTLTLARKYLEGTTFGGSRRRLNNTSDEGSKYNRKIIRRLRVNNPNLNQVTHENKLSTPLPYIRRKPGQELDNSTEDDEEIDDTDEGENIKLSESNILENSDVNRFNTNSIKNGEKNGHRKVIKRVKFPSAQINQTTTTTTPSTEPRTRKIIRKLNISITTEQTVNSNEGISNITDSEVKDFHLEGVDVVMPVTEETDNRRRKIIRKLIVSSTLKPILESSNDKHVESNKRRRPTTTTEKTSTKKPTSKYRSRPEISNSTVNEEKQRSRLDVYTRKPELTTTTAPNNDSYFSSSTNSNSDDIFLEISSDISKRLEDVSEFQNTSQHAKDEVPSSTQSSDIVEDLTTRRLTTYKRNNTQNSDRIALDADLVLKELHANLYQQSLVDKDDSNNETRSEGVSEESDVSSEELKTTVESTIDKVVDKTGTNNTQENPSSKLSTYYRNRVSTTEAATLENNSGLKRLSAYSRRRPGLQATSTPENETSNEQTSSTQAPRKLSIYTRTRPQSTTEREPSKIYDSSSQPETEDIITSSNSTTAELAKDNLTSSTAESNVDGDLTTRRTYLRKKVESEDSTSLKDSLALKRLNVYSRQRPTSFATSSGVKEPTTVGSIVDKSEIGKESVGNATEESLSGKLPEIKEDGVTTIASDVEDETETIAAEVTNHDENNVDSTKTTTEISATTESTSENEELLDLNTEESFTTTDHQIQPVQQTTGVFEITTSEFTTNSIEDLEDSTTEYSDETTTELLTTEEPKPSTPAYINKIFKMAQNRPKLDLKNRLVSKQTTESSLASSTRSSRFDLRQRQPVRPKASIENTGEVDDVGHGSVKPFKKLYRPSTSSTTTTVDEDVKELEVRVSSTTERVKEVRFGRPRFGKYGGAKQKAGETTTRKSINRALYTRPTPGYQQQEEEDDDVDDEYEEVDDPDEEYEDNEESVPVLSTTTTSTAPPLVSSISTRKSNNPLDSVTKTTTRAGFRRTTTSTPPKDEVRVMNTPYPGTPTPDIENEVTDDISRTTERATTLHHIFAESEPSPTTPPVDEESDNKNKLEKLYEVNRIVQIDEDNNNKEPIVDHIGVVNRVTVIKVVDGSNSSDGSSKVDFSLAHPEIINAQQVEIIPNQVVIESKSSVRTITPKPLFSNEVSTISLEALFKTEPTDNPLTTTPEEELLDVEHSRYVNVKVLDPNRERSGKFIPNSRRNHFVFDEVTMKAEVVEIARPPSSDLIRIAPIAVSFEKKRSNKN